MRQLDHERDLYCLPVNYQRLTMKCVTPVRPYYVWRYMCMLALCQWPNALHISSTAAGLNVGVQN